MNQNKSKLIRRIARNTGSVKADYPLHHYDSKGRLCAPSVFSSLPAPALYPEMSFQRIHHMAKRTLGRMSMAALRAFSMARFAKV